MKKFTHALAYVLSVLLILYAIPTIVYAEIIDGLDRPDGAATVDTASPEETLIGPFEVTDRREESVKHFRLPDGTFAAVQYDTPVHYRDGAGTWQDIDNTLSDSGNEYATSNARVKFEKKVTGSNALFTLHDGSRKITMSLNGAIKKTAGRVMSGATAPDAGATELQKLMTLEHLSSRILYADILDGVDLEYVLDSLNIKENIIVKERQASYTYAFTVSLNGLEAALSADGSVIMSDSVTGETVYTMPAPIVYDAEGTYADAALSAFTLTPQGNRTYTLTVTVNADWMNAPERAYPVVVDPTVYPGGSYAMTDTYVDSDNPTYAYYNFDFLAVGRGGSGQEFISYWKMNTLPALPDNAYVLSADLEMYCQEKRYHSTASTHAQLLLYEVVSDWASGLTWNAMTDGTKGALGELQGYVDYNGIGNGTVQAGQYATWDISRLYRKWIGGGENHGVAIRQQGLGQVDSLFASVNATAQHPRIVVNYRDMKGMEAYWSGSSHSAGNAGVGYVNHATGNLVFSMPLLGTGDALFGYTPTIVYNSAMAEKMNTYAYNPNVHYRFASVGYGSKLSTNESIVCRTYTDRDGQTRSYYIWSDSDGTEHAFWPDPEDVNTYRDDAGLGLTLTMAYNHYYITDQGHNVRQFTRSDTGSDMIYAGGILEHIQDSYGNKLRFNYNSKGQTTTIDIVPAGYADANALLYLTFTYNSMFTLYQVDNHLTGQRMVLEYGRVFGEEGSGTYYGGPLKEIAYMHNDGSEWVTDAVMSYTYSCSSDTGNIYRLASAKDEAAGTELRYTYDEYGRVSHITEYGSGIAGQTIAFSYVQGLTEVRSSGTDDVLQTGSTGDDIITCYTIDDAGRTISVYSTNARRDTIYGATSGIYEDGDSAAKNSLKATSVMDDATVNYIYNGDFTDQWNGWTTSGSGNVAITSSGGTTINDRLNFTATAQSQRVVRQRVNLPAGTYTLSCDVTVGEVADVDMTLRAKAEAPASFSSEQAVSLHRQQSTGIQQTPALTFTVPPITGEATSVPVTIELEVKGGASDTVQVYVDNVTLVNNIGVGAHSFIEFGGFEDTFHYAANDSFRVMAADYWTLSSSSEVSISDGGLQDTKCLKMEVDTADFFGIRYASQTIPAAALNLPAVNSEAVHAFTVSGFGKASQQIAGTNAFFSLVVTIRYNDGQEDTEYFDFNRESAEWQFISGTVTARLGKRIESITVECEYLNQPGTAYFDMITLTQESDGKSTGYAYTDTGKPEFMYTSEACEYYIYDSVTDDLVTMYHSDGFGTQYTYDPTTHAVIQEVSFTFDETASGQDLLSWWISREAEGGTAWAPATEAFSKAVYTYDTVGHVTESAVTRVSGTKDLVGLLSISKPMTSRTTYRTTADLLYGLLLSTTDTSGQTTTYTYNTKGQLLYEQYPDMSGLYYTYDALGRAQSVRPLAPLFGTAQGGVEEVSYTYNAANRLQKVNTATTEYRFAYDVFGNTTAIYAGNESTPLATYQFAPHNGKMTSMTYGNGKQIAYAYDELDRVQEICYTVPDKSDPTKTVEHFYRYTYTASGQIHSVESTEADRRYTYRYNTQGQLMGKGEFGITDADVSYQVNYEYDERQRITREHQTFEYVEGNAFRSSAISYLYWYDDANNAADGTGEVENEIGALSSIDIVTADVNQTPTFTFTYDELYRLSERDYQFNDQFSQWILLDYEDLADGHTTTRLSGYLSQLQGVSGQSKTYAYTYDGVGNIQTITDQNGQITRYAYDDLGQLIREDNPYLGKSYTYTYDHAGNRTSRKTYAYTTGTLGAATATQTLTYKSTGWGDQLANTTYDGVGNPLTYNGLELEWDGRKLVGAVMNGGQFVYTYSYNDDGIMTASNGTRYLLDGSRRVGAVDGSTLTLYLYDESGSPIGMQFRRSTDAEGTFITYYFEKNLQGDIIGVYDSAGKLIYSYTYDAWGNFTQTQGPDSTAFERYVADHNPFRYRGYIYDGALQAYYLQSRFYDPSTGRFLNADGLISTGTGILGYNMYAYCSNNPVMYVDPMGNVPWKAIGIILGLVGGGGLIMSIPILAVPTAIVVGASMPSKEEHYSRNENNLVPAQEELMGIVTGNTDTDWKPVDDKYNIYHRFTNGTQGEEARYNKKYMTSDGRNEVIICYDPEYVKEPYIVTDPNNMGTRNNGPGTGINHFLKDVVPYWMWKNAPNDTTRFWERMEGN